MISTEFTGHRKRIGNQMARVNAPLLSFGAAGQIGDTLVYASWKGRPYSRRYVIPANPRTAAQTQTRNTFRYLSRLFQYLPSTATAAWNLYGDTNRFTALNGFIKQNLSVLRGSGGINDMVMSPSANSGLIGQDLQLTPTASGVDINITAPELPEGWTIDGATGMAIRNVDPDTSEEYDVATATVANAPYDMSINGLETGSEYLVGAWFEFTRSNGTNAYGLSLTDVATPV